MSKKKKGKKANKFYPKKNNAAYESKKNKKKGKKKDSAYGEPKLKSVKLSLDKKDVKENKKILLEPVEVPKGFMKNRNRCNHAGPIISVAEFKNMTPTYAAFTPMLDTMVSVFGEDNVAVCKSCYDVLADVSKISTGDIQHAIAVLYAAANAVVSHKRMKNDEIKEIAKVKESLGDWNAIIDLFEKLEDKGAFVVDSDKAESGELTSAEMAKMSRMAGGQAYTV